MADHTHIEWTDATWNVITGCSVVSAGCKHCYAMKLAGTRLKHEPSRAGLTIDTSAGPVWNGQVRFNTQWLDQPLRWRRPRRIFVCAHGDLFHEGVPDAWLDDVFQVMASAQQHVFQVLTKRPERMRAYLSRRGFHPLSPTCWTMTAREDPERGDIVPAPTAQPLPNVWLGVSVEDQAAADARIPFLLETPAALRWISAEPLLGPVDLTRVCDRRRPRALWINAVESREGNPAHEELIAWFGPDYPYNRIDWVVAGGESGAGARPMHPDWARSLRDQCAAANVPFFFKQWGAWAPRRPGVDGDGVTDHPAVHLFPDGYVASSGNEFRQRPERSGNCSQIMWRVGKKAAGRLLDRVLQDAYPEVQP